MKKSSIVVLTVLVISCQPHSKRGDDTLQTISKNEWQKKRMSDKKDSILYISSYKETGNYVLYWVQFQERPYQISQDAKNCFEMVDDNTIFGNRCKKESNDYQVLLKKGMISFPRESKPSIDDSLEGDMYVFKVSNKNEFRKVQVVKYFELLEDVIPNKAMSFDEEAAFFDKAASILWDDNVSK
jgi:hypothetical protein